LPERKADDRRVDLNEVPPEAFQRHPWERARARFFVGALARAGLLAGPLDVLDVGAGDGFFAGELARRLPGGSRIVCYEPAYQDEHLARFARATGGDMISFVRVLPARRFDVVMLMDVLEHVPDDEAFLGALVAQQLQERGYLLVSVPAWPSLFTRYDVSVVHHRRYTPAQLAAVLRSAGLTVETGGGLFHALLLQRVVEKLAERARGIDAAPSAACPPEQPSTVMRSWRHGRVVSRSVDLALRADNAVSAALAGWRIPLPGLSAWALARR
jgi:SAM-dependent methyltransferase